jgi:hypothetical protein
VSYIPSAMSVCKSVSLSVWTVVCMYQSVTLAEYAVYREIDPDTLATAEVGIAVIGRCLVYSLSVCRSPLHPTSAGSLPGTGRMMRRLT